MDGGLPPVVEVPSDPSFGAGKRSCGWCGASLITRRRSTIYCERKCRQSAFRLRRSSAQVATSPGAAPGLTFAYADPPYPGLARKYYRDQPDYTGEVDHAALIASLAAAGYAGWALSTSSKALSDILPLCPRGARVCAWVKPIAVPASTYGPHCTWEPVIVVGGRRRRPGVRDWLRAQPARNGGSLPGRKPAAFCVWLFELLGMVPGDRLLDQYPGTGIVGRAWRELSSSRHPDDASDAASSRSSATPGRSPRRPGPGDASIVPSFLQERRGSGDPR